MEPLLPQLSRPASQLHRHQVLNNDHHLEVFSQLRKYQVVLIVDLSHRTGADGTAAAATEPTASQLHRHQVKRSTGHTHTDREQHPRHRHTHTHTHDKNNTPNPQTSTSHKHLTTLEGDP